MQNISRIVGCTKAKWLIWEYEIVKNLKYQRVPWVQRWQHPRLLRSSLQLLIQLFIFQILSINHKNIAYVSTKNQSFNFNWSDIKNKNSNVAARIKWSIMYCNKLNNKYMITSKKKSAKFVRFSVKSQVGTYSIQFLTYRPWRI